MGFPVAGTEKRAFYRAKALKSLFFAPSLPCGFGVETLDRITRKSFLGLQRDKL